MFNFNFHRSALTKLSPVLEIPLNFQYKCKIEFYMRVFQRLGFSTLSDFLILDDKAEGAPIENSVNFKKT